jgi:V/A-type H+/Na+-transporting ATPase subunit B
MIRPAAVEYSRLRSIEGPLLVLEETDGVGWDEYAEIRLDSGQVRHGVVLEADRDVAIVQVLEGTAGIELAGTRVGFSGHPMRVVVGESWLGRVCNGRGEPIDGGPPVWGEERRDVSGWALNPSHRTTPSQAVITGVSAIDGLATLVRGQKLPIFSVGGLDHLDLAVQIARQAHVGGEPFCIVFAAMGITHADASAVRDGLEPRAEAGELALFVNTAADPIIERIATPRVALTVAEHLAFNAGYHVLVIMSDMTNYAEAVREVAAARGEVPTRRGYPGYLYSDLASLYERCGRIKGASGSLTQVPVLTMPAGDITHPVPDLTGYITEGQLVLTAELAGRGVYPPLDALASLSRLMRRGAGPGRTRDDHRALAGQLYAALDQARQVRQLADLLGREALSETDQLYLRFAETYEAGYLRQERDESRSLDDTLDRAWRVLGTLPRRELGMLSRAMLDAHQAASTASETGR